MDQPMSIEEISRTTRHVSESRRQTFHMEDVVFKFAVACLGFSLVAGFIGFSHILSPPWAALAEGVFWLATGSFVVAALPIVIDTDAHAEDFKRWLRRNGDDGVAQVKRPLCG